MSVHFEITSGPHEGHTLKVDRPKSLLAGRSSQAQLKLANDPHFSRHHFRVEVAPPQCYLLDLASHNGTLVNGTKTYGTVLRDGDVISGGRTEIRVRVLKAADGDSVEDSNASPTPASDASAASGNSSRKDAAPGAGDGVAEVHIPGYRIREHLGVGSLGTLYRARHEATGKNVSVQVAQPRVSASPERVQRFFNKADALRDIDHPGIVRLVETGATPPHLYAVTEYVSAVPVERIVRKASLPSRIRISCDIACHVLQALKYAHARSLVHGDIHPANIVLSKHGKKLDVVLADFGLTRIFREAGLATIPADGQFRESFAYRAPEQIINPRSAKPASDLYSLGATLYYFLTGQPPFGKAEGVTLARKILKGRSLSLRSVVPEMPPALEAVLAKALVKDPGRRWASAEDMYNALFLFSKRSFIKRIC